MGRETLLETVIVITDENGNETEVDMNTAVGNFDEELSQSLMIGRAVRAALMGMAHDGAEVTVRVYAQ